MHYDRLIPIMTVHFDDIIYKLQRSGGITTYWRAITDRIAERDDIEVVRTTGGRYTRMLPVPTSAEVFHSSYFRNPISARAKVVVTVFDLLYEKGFIQSPNRLPGLLQRRLAIMRADAIVCISQNTRRDLLDCYPGVDGTCPIYVVPLAASYWPSTCGEPHPGARLSGVVCGSPGFVLFVGGRAGYKNFSIGLHGFASSALARQGYRMVCTGQPFTDDEKTEIGRLGLSAVVWSIPNADSAEMSWLYRNAFALIYPSLYEGFGLPLVEAMTCGCPVIASATSSMPEIVGDAGILIDPLDESQVSSAFEYLLDSEIRNSYVKQGLERSTKFNWDESARMHVAVYRSLCGGGT